MKKRSKKFSTFLVIFIFLSLSYLTPNQNKKSLNRDELEKYLKNAEIVSIEKDLELGRTNFWIVTLSDGIKERKAIFKHVNRPRPSLLPDCYKYEIAAYRLNKMLNLNIVPPVVERKIENQTGSIQLLIENVITDRDRRLRNIKPENLNEFKNDLDIILVFENLACDQCRDSSDILIESDHWKVWRVDFSEAFPPSSASLELCQIERCSKALYHRLLDLDNNKLKTELDPYLNEKEINFLLERKQLIIKTLKNLIEKKGEKQVLF